MSEIEKLYRNAGISAIPQKTKDCNYCYYYEETYDAPCHVCTADKCPFEKNIIPPFTAEKQLELIKWLSELDMLEIMRTTREDKAWIINSEYGMSGNVYKHTSRMKSFEEALAGLINSLWQDLTDAERKQIKEILE